MTNCTKNIFGTQSTSVRDSVGVGGDLLDVCIDRDKSRFVQVKFITNSSQLLQHPTFAVSNVGVGGQDCLRNVGILFWVVYKIYDYFDSMMFDAVSYTFHF